ncbi:hypothetical protein QR680_013384 [Steinernema hermaphroditum]|uniref:Mitochondrial import inner membrane translocase subunit tim-16 n=1 Tax=Steinernema hermaphroditum TaxID=289476 RepID=A0AA39I7N0_9BILA|nr:hypothetical protein QR680_013384 [Steinernema hermaphroditum]
MNAVRSFATKPSSATRQYLKRQMTDEFAQKAREHSYRARSAFKLLEMNQRYKIISQGDCVVDIGAAPGSWSQVAAEIVKPLKPTGKQGFVVGVDLQPMLPIPGVVLLPQSDITAPSTHKKIKEALGGRVVDCVISDMAPNPTGDRAMDHTRIISLCRLALDLTDTVLPLSSKGLVTSEMVWRNAAKIIIAAGEAVGKAFVRAVRDEVRATQQAAANHAARTGQSTSDAKESGATSSKLGITLQESIQILNVKEPLNAEEIEKNFQHLFEVNDKTKGGSFYLQSKVYRAKERIDEELRNKSESADAEKLKKENES